VPNVFIISRFYTSISRRWWKHSWSSRMAVDLIEVFLDLVEIVMISMNILMKIL